MPNEPQTRVPMNLGTQHEVFTLNKWLYSIAYILVKGGLIYIGYFITKDVLYEQCLLNPNVNNVVVSYFCILASACFVALGLPIEKLANISFAGGK